MIFVGLVGLLVALMHLYLWKRLVVDTTRRGLVRRIATWTLVGLAVLAMSALVSSRLLGPDLAQWIAWPGYIWFGLFVYLFVVLLVLELPRLALRRWTNGTPMIAGATTTEEEEEKDEPPATPTSSRRVFIARTAAVVAGAASTGLVTAGMVSALGPPELTRTTVALRRLHPGLAGYRIAVVSDIHVGALRGRSHTERIVRMINEAEPDLVTIVGDLVDGTVDELTDAVAPLRDLAAPDGHFFVTGNHEYYSGYEPWLGELERLGVNPLRNERTEIRIGDAAFDLAGVNDLNGKAVSDGPDFDKALGGRDESRPVILLCHQPVQVDDAAARKVDLQLSGHTHGGQIYPFHHIVKLAQGAVSGLSKVDDTWLYVTRGAGFWGPPIRVGADPEVSIIELR